MTTLRVGVVNGLTDDEIIDIRRRVRPDVSDGALWTDTLAFAREVERMATRSLRDRVRELEAERDARTDRDATVRDLIKRLRERAERAEAERDSALAKLARFPGELEGQELVRVMRERDALREGYNRALLDTSSLAADLARAEAERDALRALLRQSRDCLASCKCTRWPLIADIDAALGNRHD